MGRLKSAALSAVNAADTSHSHSPAATAISAESDALTVDSAGSAALSVDSTFYVALSATNTIPSTDSALSFAISAFSFSFFAETAPSTHAALYSATSADANTSTLWPDLWGERTASGLDDEWGELKAQWVADSADWSFWIEWYEAILIGTPLPWDFTFKIAAELTEDEWDAGQTIVSRRIGEIRSKWQLEKEIERLREQLSLANMRSATIRKHNNPPPLEDEAELAAETMTLIWNELDALETEIAKPHAEPSVLQHIAQNLWAIAERITIYCGGKIDAALEAVARELGSTATKWAIRSGVAYWISTQEGTQSVAKLAWQYAEKLLSGG